MWANLLEIQGDMPSPMLADVPRGPLPAVHSDGPNPVMFLRQEYFDQAMHRDRLRKGLELSRALR